MQSASTHVTLRVPKEVHNKLVEIANKEDCTLSKVIVGALKDFVNGQQQDSKLQQLIPEILQAIYNNQQQFLDCQQQEATAQQSHFTHRQFSSLHQQ